MEWWDNRDASFSYTFSRSELNNPPSPRYYTITPVVEQVGWELGEDEWEVNGQMIESGQNGEFIITPAIYDAYPDGTTFCYNFFNPLTATVTITVISGKWLSNKWHHEAGGAVGFTLFPQSAMEQQVVQYGSMVTVYGNGKYGSSHSSSGPVDWFYKVKGFYSPSHFKYKSGNNQEKDSWTFKATSNMTIYVEFEYIEHD